MHLGNSLVHQQYARKADLKDICDRLVSAFPSAFVRFPSYILHLFLSVLSIFIYYSEHLDPRSPGLNLNPTTSEQAQAKPKSKIPLLRHGSRRWPAIGLGRKQSFVGGRHETGAPQCSVPGDRLTFPQAPPLAVLWIYTIVQMDLGPAVLSLIFVGVWFLQSDLKFFP